jgi:predicted Rdx family selenoprotein
MPAEPVVEIMYCRLCGWGLRAGWMAQELLATFAEEIGSVGLPPTHPVADLKFMLGANASGHAKSKADFQK